MATFWGLIPTGILEISVMVVRSITESEAEPER